MKKPIVLVFALVVSTLAVKSQTHADSAKATIQYAYAGAGQPSNRVEIMPAMYAPAVYVMDEATPAEKSRLRKKKRFLAFFKKK